MSLEILYSVEVEGEGSVTFGLSRTKALKIINELNRVIPLKTNIYRRDNTVYIFLGFKKGGYSDVRVCSEGVILYDVRQDSLMICLEEVRIQSRSFIEAGMVKKGIELLKKIGGRRKAVIKKA